MLCKLQNSTRVLNLIQNRRQLRVHNTLVAMILIFWITWTPQFVFTLIAELSLLENFHNELIYAWLRLFGALNTVINPLLYGYLNSTFRKYYKKFYRKLPWYSTIQSLRK